MVWMTSQEFKSFREHLFAHPRMPKEGTLQQTRDAFERWMAEYPPPSDVRLEPFSIGPLSCCWTFARQAKRRPMILFFHGGGFVIGSVRSHWGLMGRISQASGCAVLGVNYRLAPENPYPAALEDALAAYKWLLHHPYPPEQIVFAGVSAGGNLALSLMLRLKKENLPLPKGCVCICPWVDLTRTEYPPFPDLISPDKTMMAAKAYSQIHDPNDPLISPTFGDLEGLPPLLIQTGTKEILHEEILAFAKKAEKNGVKVTLKSWPEMFHTWHFFSTQIPEGQKAIDEIGSFVKHLFH